MPLLPRPHSQIGRRPSIGITPDYVEPEGGAPRYELKLSYADAVLRAGGLPMVLPYSDDPYVIEQYVDRISGLLVTGGAFDIPPEMYGEVAREGMGITKQPRSSFELLLMQAALKRNLPVLGICGGMQLLNVALGGTLVQDILREVENARDHEQQHDRSQPAHPVEVRDGTLLSEALGKGQIMVNSTHHQAVKQPGPQVVVSAVASDGVVEAIEGKDFVFALGVQWHPELLFNSVPLHLSIYRTFVHKAREIRR